MKRLSLGFTVFIFCTVANVEGQSLPSNFVLEDAASGASFTLPTGIAIAKDGRVFVAEKRGRVYVIKDGRKLSTPFLAIETEVLDQLDLGLLGIALDPDFLQNGHVYLSYVVDPNNDGVDDDIGTFMRITRYTAGASDPNKANTSSRKVLIGQSWRSGIPVCYLSHAGSSLRFSTDGTLLVSTGEGAHYDFQDSGGNTPECFGSGRFDQDEDIGAFRAQYLKSLAGKILRIDPQTGQGLPSNPYYTGNPDDNQSRVWAYGLRNPFRFGVRPNGSSNPSDGNPGSVYIGDVGWGLWEDVNVASGGGENFGWPCYEGPKSNYMPGPRHSGCSSIGTSSNPARHTLPLFSIHHNDPALSQPSGITSRTILGGFFYVGGRAADRYSGGFFIGDWKDGWIKVMMVDASDRLNNILDFASGITSRGLADLAMDPVSNDILYANIATGRIKRIKYTGKISNNAPIAIAKASVSFGKAPLTVQFTGSDSYDPDGDLIDFSWDFGNGEFSSQRDLQYVYYTSGSYTATLSVSDAKGLQSQYTIDITVGGSPPAGQIISPKSGISVDINKLILLDATATDPDESSSNLIYDWEVLVHHNEHAHPGAFHLNGKSGTFNPTGHGAPWDVIYLEFQLRVTDSSGLTDTTASYVVINLPDEMDITRLGSPFAMVVNPDGSSNPDIAVIGDSLFPAVGSDNPHEEYITLSHSIAKNDDWIGYEFLSEHRFRKMIFQEGIQNADGGWFEDLRVQVRSNGQWQDVLYLNAVPPYGKDNGVNYESISLLFSPMFGDGIRLIGKPGGLSEFISVGELRIFEVPENIYIDQPNGGEAWPENRSKSIAWHTIGSVPYVNIEFSDDHGASWTLIENSVVNNGNYEWTVPFGTSDLCLIRLSDASDGNPFDVSDNVFSVIPEPPPTFYPSQDAHVKLGSTRNYGLDTIIRLKSSSSIYHGYLQFDLTNIGGIPNKAILRLFVTDPGKGTEVSLFEVSNNYSGTINPWNETGIHAGNAPSLGNVLIASVNGITINTWAEFDVTTMIRGPGIYSFGLSSPSSSSMRFSSKDGPSPPEIVLESTASGGPTNFELSTSISGNGNVSLSPPGGSYGHGTMVTLTAQADHDWQFESWAGDTTGTINPVTVLMNQNKQVTAHFVQTGAVHHILSTATVGTGTVTPSGGSYHDGEQLQLTAAPAAGWQFDVWQGDASGSTNPVNLIMNANKTVTAVFSQAPVAPTQYSLATAVQGQGSVSPAGGTHDAGTTLALAASPSPGWQFDRWQGDLSGSTNPMNLLMNSSKSVTAVFVESAPSGSGHNTTFAALSDAYVKAGSSRNYGGASILRTKTASSVYHSYLKFRVSGLSAGVSRAVLRLFVNDEGSGGNMPVYSVSNNYSDGTGAWQESALTGLNAPQTGGTILAMSSPLSAGSWAEFDVTGAISGNGDFSFCLTTPHSNSVYLSSKEGANPPQLVVDSGGLGGAPPAQYSLNLSVQGQGSVTPSSGSHVAGTTVSIEAVPVSGWQFDKWQGDLNTTTNPTNLTLDGDKAVTAVFSQIPVAPTYYALTLAVQGQGSMTPSSGNHVAGASVTVEAFPASGWQFDRWQGDLNSAANPASLTMNGNKQVTAVFVANLPTGGSTTLTPVADAYIKSGSSRNYGTSPILRNKTASSVYVSYLKFQVSGLTSGIQRAILRLYVDDPGDGGTMPVYSISNAYSDGSGPWLETGITGLNAPLAGGSVLATSSPLSAGTWTEFDVTNAITGNGEFSFCLNTALSNSVYLSSKEGANAPQLVIQGGVLAKKMIVPESLTNSAIAILPDDYGLEQNYPNPFNPTTTIRYHLPQPAQVLISIFDLSGREITVLVSQSQASGHYSIDWNGRDHYGRQVPAGIYFYRMDSGSFNATRKMILLP